MNTPPKPQPPPSSPEPKRPLVVIPKYTRADIFRIIFLAVAILGTIALLLVLGMKHIKKNSGRLPLTGVILSHYKTGVRETELDVSRRGVKKDVVDTGFYVKVSVAGEEKPYESPCTQTVPATIGRSVPSIVRTFPSRIIRMTCAAASHSSCIIARGCERGVSEPSRR
jgi:hypothetical protein